jgi:hypothetical protein
MGSGLSGPIAYSKKGSVLKGAGLFFKFTRSACLSRKNYNLSMSIEHLPEGIGRVFFFFPMISMVK